MDSTLKRKANPGFLLIVAAFFALPSLWVFYIALITGYAHGTQGFYGGYRSGRFKVLTIILATLAIYPLTQMPLLILVMTAATMSIFHFVTDEYFLLKKPVSNLTRTLFPGLLVLLIGTLCVFFNFIERHTVLLISSLCLLLPLLIFSKRLQKPTAPESGVLILIPTVLLALAFTEHTKLAVIVHLMGLLHFWSWYVEYFYKNKSRKQQISYLKQCTFFFATAALIGFLGLYLEWPVAKEIFEARTYFAWIIVHSVLSFRSQDIGQWLQTSRLESAPEQSA